MSLLVDYKAHAQERANEGGLPPLALTPEQVADLVELLKADTVAESEYVLDLFNNKSKSCLKLVTCLDLLTLLKNLNSHIEFNNKLPIP